MTEVAGIGGKAALAIVADIESAASGEVVGDERIHAQVVTVLVLGKLSEHAGAQLGSELVEDARDEKPAVLIMDAVEERLIDLNGVQLPTQTVPQSRRHVDACFLGISVEALVVLHSAMRRVIDVECDLARLIAGQLKARARQDIYARRCQACLGRSEIEEADAVVRILCLKLPEVLQLRAEQEIGAGIFQFAARAIALVVIQFKAQLTDAVPVDEWLEGNVGIAGPAIGLGLEAGVTHVDFAAEKLALYAIRPRI